MWRHRQYAFLGLHIKQFSISVNLILTKDSLFYFCRRSISIKKPWHSSAKCWTQPNVNNKNRIQFWFCLLFLLIRFHKFIKFSLFSVCHFNIYRTHKKYLIIGLLNEWLGSIRFDWTDSKCWWYFIIYLVKILLL